MPLNSHPEADLGPPLPHPHTTHTHLSARLRAALPTATGAAGPRVRAGAASARSRRPSTDPRRAQAISNAGGFGTMGCSSLSPEGVRSTIRECKALLDPGRHMGVDLLLPKTGEGAKKTNKSYTADTLEAIVM